MRLDVRKALPLEASWLSFFEAVLRCGANITLLCCLAASPFSSRQRQARSNGRGDYLESLGKAEPLLHQAAKLGKKMEREGRTLITTLGVRSKSLAEVSGNRHGLERPCGPLHTGDLLFASRY